MNQIELNNTVTDEREFDCDAGICGFWAMLCWLRDRRAASINDGTLSASSHSPRPSTCNLNGGCHIPKSEALSAHITTSEIVYTSGIARNR